MSHSEAAPSPVALAGYGDGVGHHLEALRRRETLARATLATLTPPNWHRGRGFSLSPDPIDLGAYRPVRMAARQAPAVPGGSPALVLVDGVLAGGARDLPDGFEVNLLGPGGSDILPDELVTEVGSVTGPDADYFSALNLAYLTSVIVVRVGRRVSIATPLRIRHVLAAAGAIGLSRVVILLEDGARATVIEETVSAAPDAATDVLSVPVTEIRVGDGAHLVYVDVSDVATTHRVLSKRRAMLARDSRLEWRSGLFGGRFVAADWETELVGEGAQLEASGTYLAAGRDQFALTSRTWHRVPHTTAQVLFRGAAYGQSQSVFDGIIGADKTAKGTQAHLSDHLLFLSRDARADSIPSLLIEGDDVNVGHGATIGRIDPEQLYFMESRGIDPREARRLLVAGYFDPVIDRIPDEALRESQRAAIARRLAEIPDTEAGPGTVSAETGSQSMLVGTDLEHQAALEGR